MYRGHGAREELVPDMVARSPCDDRDACQRAGLVRAMVSSRRGAGD